MRCSGVTTVRPCGTCRTVNKEEKSSETDTAKLFVFLRQIRHALFVQNFKQNWQQFSKDSTVGLCPVAPTMPDNHSAKHIRGLNDEAMEAIEMD